MQSIAEQDLGTPQRLSEKLVTLTIDGREVTVPEGTSVMRAAGSCVLAVPSRTNASIRLWRFYPRQSIAATGCGATLS